MSSKKANIKLKAFDHKKIDDACTTIIDTVKRTGGRVSGPVPLPTDIESIKILVNNLKRERIKDLSLLKTQVRRRLRH